jgi:pyruvate dehydrogenase E1 component alpha subunit
MRLQKRPAVAVGYVGDGGANTGRTWEFVNLAALWKLPFIAICENNLYAVETHISHSMAGDSIAGRAAGFGLPAVAVDGQDILAVHAATAEARERALRGDGPTFIEARTYRYEGHNVGDVQNYRETAEVESWREKQDPIDRLRRRLAEHGDLEEPGYAALERLADETVADAIDFAEQSPWPDTGTVDLSWPAPQVAGASR